MDAAFSRLFFKAPVNIPIRHGFIAPILIGNCKLADGRIIGCIHGNVAFRALVKTAIPNLRHIHGAVLVKDGPNIHGIDPICRKTRKREDK
ncbi:hypothetical protein SDC9_195147 [bioreactor metagenome]|uniref:Uncharacterized protein n=1 Tax=bioreactor metagenome TaxID=1076179 RepID=A0A645IGV9_9ZZZZ